MSDEAAAKSHSDKPYECFLCFKIYTCKSTLTKHLQTHTRLRDSFVCEPCDRPFRSEPALVRHFFAHTGAKPFSCDVCGMSFTRRFILMEHLRTHTGEKPHICEVCNKVFWNPGEM